MAFHWADLHERAWLESLRTERIETESKRTLAGSALHLDLAARGDVSGVPPFESIPPGRIAFEFRAPGRTTGIADVYRFYGLLGLLLERDARERLRTKLDSTTGILIASRISRAVVRARSLRPREVEPGILALEGLRPRLFVIGADELVPGRRTARIILYHGSDRAIGRLVRERPEDEWLPAAARVYLYRRKALEPALKARKILMSKLDIDVKEAVEFIGLRRVIDEVGLKRVIDEVGLKRVIDEFGLERLIEEGGIDQVQETLDRIRREKGIEPRRDAP